MSPSAYNEAAEAGESEPIAIVGMGKIAWYMLDTNVNFI